MVLLRRDTDAARHRRHRPHHRHGGRFNVLIYERIREEAQWAAPSISSLDAGFNRAFATIVDFNVTMFVAAVILYFFGSGPVRGFAVSLGLGILTHRHRGDDDSNDDRALVSLTDGRALPI